MATYEEIVAKMEETKSLILMSPEEKNARRAQEEAKKNALANAFTDFYYDEDGKPLAQVKNLTTTADRTFVIKTDEDTQSLYDTEEKRTELNASSNPIPSDDFRRIKKLLKSGNFVENDVQAFVVQIENIAVLRQMYQIVSKDNGKGGDSDANNREYGGTIATNGVVKESPTGAVGSPKTGVSVAIEHSINQDTKTTFHSHPSGKIVEKPQSDDMEPNVGSRSGVGGTKSTTYYFMQPPSSPDVNNAGVNVAYVFARHHEKVYVYNNSGILAIFKDKCLR